MTAVYDQGRMIGIDVVRPSGSEYLRIPVEFALAGSLLSGIGACFGASGGGLLLSAGFCTCVDPDPVADELPEFGSVGAPVDAPAPGEEGEPKFTGPGDTYDG